MKKSVKKSTLLILLISALVLSLNLFVFLFYVLFVRNKEGVINESFHTRSYQYLALDLNNEKESYSFGVIDLDTAINDNEFEFSKHDKSNRYVLISNFGSTEYQCMGLCTCHSDEDSRKSLLSGGSSKGLGISHRLMYLLVAVSSYAAYELSSNYFRNECFEQMSYDDNCRIETIDSEVVGCKQIYGEEDGYWREKYSDFMKAVDEINEKAAKEDEEMSKKLKMDGGKDLAFLNFWCKGHCVANPSMKEMTESTEEYCREIKFEGEVTQTIYTRKIEQSDNDYEHSDYKNLGLELSIKEFQFTTLIPGCRAHMKEKSQITPEESEMIDWDKTAMCLGVNPEKGFFNPSIQCRRMKDGRNVKTE